MAGSRPDVIIPQFEWTNLYAKTGIATGVSLIIQNKNQVSNSGQGDLLIFESKDRPDKDSRDGELLAPGQRTRAVAGSPGIWVMSRWCEGRIFVQERPS